MGTHKISIGGRLMNESNMKNSCIFYGLEPCEFVSLGSIFVLVFNRVGNENAQQVRYYCSLLLDIASPFL